VKRRGADSGRASAAAAPLGGFAERVALFPVRVYQRLISPLLPARCKYYPTCSRYAVEAVREVGVVRGAILAAWRLARCNPWSKGGIDTVEDRPFFRGRGSGTHEHGKGLAA
jgi:uncharacterized protein